VGTELDRAREGALRAHSVTASQQRFAEQVRRLVTRSVSLPGRNQCALGVAEQTRFEIHAADRPHHERIGVVPGLGAVRDFAHPIFAARAPNLGAERDGRVSRRIVSPAGEEALERAHEPREYPKMMNLFEGFTHPNFPGARSPMGAPTKTERGAAL